MLFNKSAFSCFKTSSSKNIYFDNNNYIKKNNPKQNEIIVITPALSQVELKSSQLNYENADYINRKPYHHYDNGKILNFNNN